jgi:hypothetical protein
MGVCITEDFFCFKELISRANLRLAIVIKPYLCGSIRLGVKLWKEYLVQAHT